MNAMENASKNAREIVDKLNLQYNKARQARITMELVEIISGASALWGRQTQFKNGDYLMQKNNLHFFISI